MLLHALHDYFAILNTFTVSRAWEGANEGVHPEWLHNDDKMRQKIKYFHMNSVKRGFVDQPEHRRHSGTRDYVEQAGLLTVTRYG